MQRLIEFTGNHPYLVGAAVLMTVIVIVSEIRARIQAFAALSANDAIRMMNHNALVIDVRPAALYQSGHIAEARNLDPKTLAENADSLKKYREKPVIVCCDSGMESGAAARQLTKLGFQKVFNLRGGLNAWRQENLPLTRGQETSGGKQGGKQK